MKHTITVARPSTGAPVGAADGGRAAASRRGDGHVALPSEIAVVWLLLAVVATEVLVTYSRLDPTELYHVSRSGFGAGAGRVLVLLNFPFALISIGLLLLLGARLRGPIAAVALAGIALCAAVFWPGVVDPGDLDARPVNAIAALGVAVALAVTLLVWRGRGIERPVAGVAALPRLALASIVFLLALPWMLADLGVSLNGVPVLGTLYQTGELRAQPGNPTLHPAVHHGHHHGMDGALLVWSALLLAPLLTTVRRGRARLAGAYLALMFCYGAAEVANDFWLEQVVKRGWTDWQIPDVTEPKLSAAWSVILLATVVVWAFFTWRSRDAAPPARTVTDA